MKNIGLLATLRDNKFYFNEAYYYFANQFGNVHLITPYQEYASGLDLLILPGGEDVVPARYNEAPLSSCGLPNYPLEYFDVAMLPKYIENQIPILGICRGFQTLNVHFGGSLYQHLPDEPYSSESRWDLVHGVVDENNRYVGQVNSLHHQGIKNLGHDLSPTLISNKKNGCIEAFKHNTLPIIGFQFHPEELWDYSAAKQINEWVNEQIISIIS